MSIKRYKGVTQEDFNKVKALQVYKLTCTQTGKITGRASSTVSMMYRSETFRDYKNLVTKTNSRKPSGVLSVDTPKPVQSDAQVIATYLKGMNKKLDYLIELWTVEK